jgi:hypothetical protein
MSNKRDNFSPKTVRALAQRAGYRCSFPGCNQLTVGPSEESLESITNIGIAAHIHAAAPGPLARRYDPNQTPEERKDISNGIWMCANHSVEIDRDETRYTAAIIKDMKRVHEEEIKNEVSNSLPSSKHNDFIAIGIDIIVFGELTGISSNEWTVKFSNFFTGDLSKLISFNEKFNSIPAEEKFILINHLGEGRSISAPVRLNKLSDGYEVTIPVELDIPRTNCNKLPRDLDIFTKDDLFVDSSGDIATVSGFDALPQQIYISLSTIRGEMHFHPTLGSRIREFFHDFEGTMWLDKLVKLEVIRLSCIPCFDSFAEEKYTPLKCVKNVKNIRVVSNEYKDNKLPIEFTLDIEGFGIWTKEISVFSPKFDK